MPLCGAIPDPTIFHAGPTELYFGQCRTWVRSSWPVQDVPSDHSNNTHQARRHEADRARFGSRCGGCPCDQLAAHELKPTRKVALRRDRNEVQAPGG